MTIPDGVERIGNHWFWRAKVESVTIPASVREIGVEAFSRCKRLENVAFEEGSRLKIIRKGAFRGCSSIKNI